MQEGKKHLGARLSERCARDLVQTPGKPLLAASQIFPRAKKRIFRSAITPLTPMNDQDKISPHNVNSISSRQVIRLEKNKVASFAKGCKMDAKRS